MMNNKQSTILLILALILVSLFSLACSSTPKFLVNGSLSGEEIHTTVDSEILKYYLENYLKNDRTNPDYDSMIDETLKIWDDRPLDSESLRELSEQFSPDFATVYFVSRIYQNPVNRKAQQAFHAQLESIRHKSAEGRFQFGSRN